MHSETRPFNTQFDNAVTNAGLTLLKLSIAKHRRKDLIISIGTPHHQQRYNFVKDKFNKYFFCKQIPTMEQKKVNWQQAYCLIYALALREHYLPALKWHYNSLLTDVEEVNACDLESKTKRDNNSKIIESFSIFQGQRRSSI